MRVCFVDRCLSFCAFFPVGHCVVCSSSINVFWLSPWCLQTLLTIGILPFLWDFVFSDHVKHTFLLLLCYHSLSTDEGSNGPTQRAAQHVIHVADTMCTIGGVSGYCTESPAVYHSRYRAWRMHVKDLFCRFRKKRVCALLIFSNISCISPCPFFVFMQPIHCIYTVWIVSA